LNLILELGLNIRKLKKIKQMKKYFFLLGVVGFGFLAKAQEITGEQLLDKAIAYHDPNGNWKNFEGGLNITFTDPKGKERLSKVYIDFPAKFFSLLSFNDDKRIQSTVKNDNCRYTIDGDTTVTEADKEKYRLKCDRTKMMKNYYTYLYGLPMKLKDKGTIIDPKVVTKKFKGKEYLVLKATYEAAVGEDTWYFYFDPKTYAMEVYQFFHDESKNDGEYILLKGEKIISGVKMPKNRTWYYNKEDKLLGTDSLK